MHREAVAYIHSGILLSHKKEWNLPFATTWVELEGIRLSELSQTEKEMLYDLSYRSNQRQTRNKAPANSQIQRTDWWSPEAGRGWKETVWVNLSGTLRCEQDTGQSRVWPGNLSGTLRCGQDAGQTRVWPGKGAAEEDMESGPAALQRNNTAEDQASLTPTPGKMEGGCPQQACSCSASDDPQEG